MLCMLKDKYIRKSMLMDYWYCPRRFRYRWIDRIERETSYMAHFGTMFHEAAAQYAISGIVPETEYDFLNEWLSRLVVFDEVYSTNTKIYAVEQEYISDDLKIKGTIDRIDVFDNGTYRIVEYKTGAGANLDMLRRELHFYYLLFTSAERDKEVSLLCVFNPRKELYIEFTPTKRMVNSVKKKLNQLRSDTKFKMKWNEYACPNCSYFDLCLEEVL